jgi:hypothetical protein
MDMNVYWNSRFVKCINQHAVCRFSAHPRELQKAFNVRWHTASELAYRYLGNLYDPEGLDVVKPYAVNNLPYFADVC